MLSKLLYLSLKLSLYITHTHIHLFYFFRTRACMHAHIHLISFLRKRPVICISVRPIENRKRSFFLPGWNMILIHNSALDGLGKNKAKWEPYSIKGSCAHTLHFVKVQKRRKEPCVNFQSVRITREPSDVCFSSPTTLTGQPQTSRHCFRFSCFIQV